MAVTRTQWEALFNHAWGLARGARTKEGTYYRDDPAALAQRVWESAPKDGDVTFQTARGAAVQAIKAIEAARALDTNRADRGAALAGDYGLNRGIDRRRGNYEYRVIVRGSGKGNQFETIVFVRSDGRLSGADIIEQAERQFVRNEGLHRNYGKRIKDLGAAPKVDSFIMSASRNPG